MLLPWRARTVGRLNRFSTSSFSCADFAAAQTDVLHEVDVGVELRRRPQVGDRARRVAEAAERRQRERRRVDPGRRRMIGRGEPILVARRSSRDRRPATRFGRAPTPPPRMLFGLLCADVQREAGSARLITAAIVQPPMIASADAAVARVLLALAERQLDDRRDDERGAARRGCRSLYSDRGS